MVTQSAVSAALAALQESVGVRLLRRDGRGVRLTDAGEVYTGYVRQVLGLLDEGRAAAAGDTDPERGTVRIAALTTAGEQLLPRLLAGFRNRYPHAGLSVEVGNRQRAIALIGGHEVDLLIGGRPPSDQDIVVLALRRNELVVVAAPSEPDDTEPVEWLARQTWLLREHGSGTRAATEALLAGFEIEPLTLTVGSNSAIRESVIAGLGVTLISRDAVTRELADGGLIEVDTPLTPLRRDWHLVANRGRLPATARLFVSHLLESGDFRPPRREGQPDETSARATRPRPLGQRFPNTP